MKKIGIVGAVNHNYGSILQTFALQKAVQNLGYYTEIIRYCEPLRTKFRRLRNFDYAISRLKIVQRKLMMTLVYRKHNHNLSMRSASFRSFIDSRLNFSILCNSHSELKKIVSNYDIFLLGSDQLWRPENLLMDYFTLNFVPDQIRKVAYAQSFGVNKIPKKMQPNYSAFLSRFSYLSCREKLGVELIKQLTNRDAKWVCDPTLLLSAENWVQYMSSDVKYDEKYVFCYFIGDNPNQRKLSMEFARQKGCKVVALIHIDEFILSDEKYADYTPYNIGPSQFLYLINKAEYVMTDSFHGTVFSLLFHKEFFTFNRFKNGIKKSTTSRIDSLLDAVNMMDRKMPFGLCLDNLQHASAICYEHIDEKLAEFRMNSMKYLIQSLK